MQKPVKLDGYALYFSEYIQVVPHFRATEKQKKKTEKFKILTILKMFHQEKLTIQKIQKKLVNYVLKKKIKNFINQKH